MCDCRHLLHELVRLTSLNQVQEYLRMAHRGTRSFGMQIFLRVRFSTWTRAWILTVGGKFLSHIWGIYKLITLHQGASQWEPLDEG